MKEDVANEIKGNSIMNFYRTKNSNTSIYHPDGLGELKWYELIIETENNNKYKIGEDFIEKWEGNQMLIKIEPNHSEKIRKSKVVQIILEKEYKGIYLKFENEYLVYHDTFFGSEFIIEKYDEIFNASGELK